MIIKSAGILRLIIPVAIAIFIALVASIGLFFLIRYFIRYGAQQNKAKTPQQEEMDKMNIEDL